jgi:hypothetical protein
MTDRALIGALSGAISALAFAGLHALMISDIWFMLIPMLIAGGLCGLGLAWSFALLVDSPTSGSWLRYNLLYLLLLFGLAPLSLLLFEPIITIPALVASPNGLPDELVREVLPLTIAYTALMVACVLGLYGRRWSRAPVVLPTCALLMLLLGLNIAPLGLVHLTAGWVGMLVELLALILSLNLVYVALYRLLARRWFARAATTSAEP